MKRKRNSFISRSRVTILAMVAAGLLLAGAASPPAFAQNPSSSNANVAPFDFSDSFYRQNGINLTSLAGVGGRVGVTPTGQPCVQTSGTGRNTSCNAGGFGFPNQPGATALNWVSDNTNTDPTRAGTRILQTTGGFDANGNLIYYNIYGTLNDDSFFDDTDCPTSSDPQFDFTGCGTRANLLANQFRAFIQVKQKINGSLSFPDPTKCTTVDTTTGLPPGILPTVADSTCVANSGGIVFAPPPGNRRQDNVFETKPTYFCQNLLGLWLMSFTAYTANAYLPSGQYASSAAQAAIAPIAGANGTNLDGTAVLERVSEIDSLTTQGFLQQFVMPRASHAGAPRYVV